MEATNTAVSALIAALGPADDETGWTKDVDMLPLLFNFTLDTATDFLFGESVNSQDAAIRVNNPAALISIYGGKGEIDVSKAPSAQFGKDLEVIREHILLRIRLMSLYWLGDGIRFRKALTGVKRFTEYVRSVTALVTGASS